MKTLIVEDDTSSRILLQNFLDKYGRVDIAVNGKEAIGIVQNALDAGEPYELICLDIKMPEMDGHAALKEIRRMEETCKIDSTRRARIIMVTAIDDPNNIIEAYLGLCDAYLVKPIHGKQLLDKLQKLCLIK